MIEAREIVKRFDSFLALNGVNLSLKDGKVMGLVGSNGAGKSTLIRALAGVYSVDGGEVLIAGEPIWENVKIKETIAYIPDELYLPQNATLLSMARMYQNVFQNFDEPYFKELVVRFGLKAGQPFGTYSKGMKRQAAVILALARRPMLMLFDETFDGLDPIVRNFVKGVICGDVFDRHASAIITSHSLRELEDVCDSLALMHMGKVIVESDIANLKTRQFKVQIAFNEEYDISRFDGIEITKFKKLGSVSSMIVKADREQIYERLKAMNPSILDILPLSLEEVFSYELDALGYNFEQGGRNS